MSIYLRFAIVMVGLPILILFTLAIVMALVSVLTPTCVAREIVVDGFGVGHLPVGGVKPTRVGE